MINKKPYKILNTAKRDEKKIIYSIEKRKRYA